MPSKSANAALAPLDAQRRYSLKTAAEYLAISRTTLYREIKAGEISVIRKGGRVFCPGSELIRHSTLAAPQP